MWSLVIIDSESDSRWFNKYIIILQIVKRKEDKKRPRLNLCFKIQFGFIFGIYIIGSL